MRILLTKKSNHFLLEYLKNQHKVKTNADLAKQLNIPYKTFEKWVQRRRYVPDKIIPTEIIQELKIIDRQENTWGARKGGKLAFKKILETYDPKIINSWRSNGGKTSWRIAQKQLKNLLKDPIEGYFYLRQKKLKKTIQKIKFQDELENDETIVALSKITDIVFSAPDNARRIILPKYLSIELAEEIGMHTGDGTLSKKNYFSIRGDIREKDYYVNWVIPLYKRLYNLNLRLLERPPICGIEFSSKALLAFKNKIFGLPIGEKVNKIEVPKIILESKNIHILNAYMRGILDTDGCVYFLKKRRYPKIIIQINSPKLMEGINCILKRLGYIPQFYRKNNTIYLNGPILFKKWVDEIGSHNSKHLTRIERIKTLLPWYSLDKFIEDSRKNTSLRSL